MGKIAGLKGRSPETYPNARNPGVVSTQAHVNPDAVGTLTTGLTTLLTSVIDVLPGPKALVMYSGVVSVSSSGAIVTVSVVVDDLVLYAIEVAAESGANSPAPFGLIFETSATEAATPDPHTIDIQASASVGGIATVAANGSIVVIATGT